MLFFNGVRHQPRGMPADLPAEVCQQQSEEIFFGQLSPEFFLVGNQVRGPCAPQLQVRGLGWPTRKFSLGAPEEKFHPRHPQQVPLSLLD